MNLLLNFSFFIQKSNKLFFSEETLTIAIIVYLIREKQKWWHNCKLKSILKDTLSYSTIQFEEPLSFTSKTTIFESANCSNFLTNKQLISN